VSLTKKKTYKKPAELNDPQNIKVPVVPNYEKRIGEINEVIIMHKHKA
jgi:hypothetical protein